MLLLLLGIAIFAGLHLVKAVAPARRAALIDTYGDKGWKVAVTLALVLSVLLIVIGYRWTGYAWGSLYYPAPWAWHLNNLLMLVAFILFGAGHGKGNIRRHLRHPMLTSVMVWSVAHLLANGETRAVVLFGGLGLWALISIFLINRRDGAWQRPAPGPRSADIKTVLIGTAVFVVVALIHPWVFGVSPFPM